MHYYEITKFLEKIDKLIAFYTNIAANEDNIYLFGWKRILLSEEWIAVSEILQSIGTDAYGILKICRSISTQLHDELDVIFYDNKLITTLTTSYVTIDIESKKSIPLPLQTTINMIVNFLSKSFAKRSKDLFNTVNLHELIASLHRVRQISGIAKEQLLFLEDDSIFTYSHINPNTILDYIDNAIRGISAAYIPEDQKQKIIIQLIQTKQDIAEKSTPWKKIVGSLLIIASLLSGISDAPQAFDNVNKAINHIIGKAVQPVSPLSLPSHLAWVVSKTPAGLPPGKSE